jgi:hypothetical protein
MSVTLLPSSHIVFQFDLDRSVRAMAYLVDQLGAVEKIKLLALLYVADRTHLLRHGYPITGDQPYAMEWGPVPLTCMNVLNGTFLSDPDAAFRCLHVADTKVMLRQRPSYEGFRPEETETLVAVVRESGGKDTWALVRETQGYPEYKSARVEPAPAPIPYELILRDSGDESRFRMGRPVISPATAARMVSPFPASDADL